MSVADVHLEVIETDYGVLLCVGLFLFVGFVHLGLNDFTCALVALAEVCEGCFPTF